MARGDGGAKRWLRVSVCSWLLVASVVGASSFVGSADVQSTATHSTAAFQSTTALEPRVDFACERVAVTARSYDAVTLVFEDGERQTFRWSFRGRNVFFGTGENLGAVVAAVVVRRDGDRFTRRNPDFEPCTGRTATAGVGGTSPTAPTPGTTPTVGTTGTPATTVSPATTATAVSPTTAATVTLASPGTTGLSPTATATPTTPTLDWPTVVGITTTATAPPGTTVRATTIPTPTVTPRPIAGYPECSDEEFGLANALNLTYENGTFASPNATEVGENRFRFALGDETYEVELVAVERNEAGRPVSVGFDSTLGVDAVVVRSGQGANVYAFPDSVFRRTDLRAPTDRNTGRPFAVEEVAFCYDPGTATRTENGDRPLDDVGLGFLVGRDATVAVGLAAAGLLALRRRRGA